MVADDTPDILTMVKDIIEMMGHQVITASDGVQMVEKAKSLHPKLIVADIMMPGAYGSAAHKALQEDSHTKAIPVIFLTAVTPEQAKQVVTLSDNVRILHKPVDVPTLMAAVKEFLPGT